jgi:hypothetical protein
MRSLSAIDAAVVVLRKPVTTSAVCYIDDTSPAQHYLLVMVVMVVVVEARVKTNLRARERIGMILSMGAVIAMKERVCSVFPYCIGFCSPLS